MTVFPNNAAVGGLKLSGTAVALGQFDAIHIGHTEIIRRTVEYANAHGLKSLVFMFSNDPSEVICGRQPKAINSLERRLDVLDGLGVDIAVVTEFDSEFMGLSCAEFTDEYLVSRFGAAFAAAGYNYSFGRNGTGSIKTLDAECAKHGIRVCAVPEVTADGKPVSSTIIRQKIESGEVASAARLMGRYFTLDGTVERGNNIGGRVLGFPTANTAIPSGFVVPKLGVYISRACIDGTEYPAITNVGARPTVNEDRMCIEPHILGEFGELYRKKISVSFCRYIRGITKFDGVDALKEQLAKDRSASKSFFENNQL